MLKEIFAKNPEEQTLLNEGVASVNDAGDEASLRVLEYEARTFVCQGQYHQGLKKVLENFLANLSRSEQKAVWISGFFGSGKSHLAKIIRAFWVNQEFPGGRKARDVANLPEDVRVLLKDLDTQGKRHGGLHAVSGTLSSGGGDHVRMTVLSFLFRSKGLPGKYGQAMFCLWLKDQGVFDAVREIVERQGRDWSREVVNFLVSPVIRKAVAEALPAFSNPEELQNLFIEQFKSPDDVDDGELVDAVKRTLTENGKFPLTLIVMDEVQQYINANPNRGPVVQELVETLSKAFGSRVLFLGTGQNALSGTELLQKLMGRFQVPINLSDNDTDTVVRENILKKNPASVGAIQKVLDEKKGEIDSHLSGTPLAPMRFLREDAAWIVADYPLLPVRRRFWEAALRSADKTGTASQLRNQLRMVFEAVKESARESLGYVVPADYIYDQNVVSFEQNGILPRELRTLIEGLRASADERDRLKGRLVALCYLLGKINEGPPDDRVPCTVKNLGDLLVTDLRRAHTAREKVEELLSELVKDGHLLETPDGFGVQTREGARWTQEYRRFTSVLANNPEQVNQYRRERLYAHLERHLGKITLKQGETQTTRTLIKSSSGQPPRGDEPTLWIQNGWDADEEAVKRVVRSAGPDSALMVLFLPRHSGDEVKTHLMEYKAADNTLAHFGAQSGPEGLQAMAAMETLKKGAERRLEEQFDRVIEDARLWIGGGTEIQGISLVGKIEEAAERVLTRLYPEFSKGDSPKWQDVVEAAQKRAANCLERLGFTGDPQTQPVCAAIVKKLGPGLSWNEVRGFFEKDAYGWPRDTVDGALYALWVNNVVAVTKSGKEIAPGDVPRKELGPCTVTPQKVQVGAADRIKVRSLFHLLGVSCNSGEEAAKADEFRSALRLLRSETGGDPPLPAPARVSWWEDVDGRTGLSYLKALADMKDAIASSIDEWKQVREKKEKRLVTWGTLKALIVVGMKAPGMMERAVQADAIQRERVLLLEPDPVPHLLHASQDAVHAALNGAWSRYEEAYRAAKKRLEEDPLWKKLGAEDRKAFLETVSFAPAQRPKPEGAKDLVDSLLSVSLDGWEERSLAWEAKTTQLLTQAAKLLEPKTISLAIPRPSGALTSEAEVDRWLAEVKASILKEIGKGPVLPR